MRKEKYEEAKIEIIRLTATDVLLNSPLVPGEDDEVSGQAP